MSVVDTTTGTRTKFVAVGQEIDNYPQTLVVARVPQRTADVSVTLGAPARAALGDVAGVTATVTNAGPLTAPGVTVSLSLTGPASALSSGTAGCAVHPGTVTCALGDLAPGATRTVRVDVEPGSPGTVEISATAQSPAGPPDPDPADNATSRSFPVGNDHGCTVIGTLGDDILAGTPGADVVCALAGDDRIVAGAGGDTAYGGSGRDLVAGGPGDDRLIGGSGQDLLDGGPGADTVDGRDGAGGDLLYGGLGGDTCPGDAGDLRISCP